MSKESIRSHMSVRVCGLRSTLQSDNYTHIRHPGSGVGSHVVLRSTGRPIMWYTEHTARREWLGQPCRNWNHGTHFLWNPRAAPTFLPRYPRNATMYSRARSTFRVHSSDGTGGVTHRRAWLYGRMWENPSRRNHPVRRRNVVARLHTSTGYQRLLPRYRRVQRATDSTFLVSKVREECSDRACDDFIHAR